MSYLHLIYYTIPLNIHDSNSLFTQNLGSEQNFQQFIGKFVVYHFYHIVLFCCIAKSIYSAIPYDVFVYDSCAQFYLWQYSYRQSSLQKVFCFRITYCRDNENFNSNMSQLAQLIDQNITIYPI